MAARAAANERPTKSSLVANRQVCRYDTFETGRVYKLCKQQDTGQEPGYKWGGVARNVEFEGSAGPRCRWKLANRRQQYVGDGSCTQ